MGGGATNVGIPLGNLTSQFLANVYLNELDQYVKKELKVKYYIRYVDDFVILHNSPKILEFYKNKIDLFLKKKLKLKLHPDKSKILSLNEGVNFLGFRIFYNYKLVRQKNLRKFEKKLIHCKELYKIGIMDRDKAIEIFEGWIAYVKHANTYKYRRHLTMLFNKFFPINKNQEIKRVYKEESIAKKIEISNYEFTTQKTFQLLKKGLTIKQIAEQRQIKESTVWGHIAKLIEYGQLKLWNVLPKQKITKILLNIKNQNDKLIEIKERLNDPSIRFEEINCVLASVKSENKKRRLPVLFNNYKNLHCFRKCYFNPKQRDICSGKIDNFISKNYNLEFTKKEFLGLFNDHTAICILPREEKLKVISWYEFLDYKQRVLS